MRDPDHLRTHPVRKEHYLRVVANLNHGERLILKDFPHSTNGEIQAAAWIVETADHNPGKDLSARTVHCVDEVKL
jgi:hypothetical protein